MKWIIPLLLSFLVLAMPVEAAKRDKKSYALSMKIFKKLEEAQLLAEEENYDEAMAILDEMLEKRSSDYEKAQIHNLKGALFYRKNDYKSALDEFVAVLESAGNMPTTLHQQTLKTVVQLNLMQEYYATARDYCLELIALAREQETLDQKDFALLAQSYFKLEDWQGAKDAALEGRKVAYDQQKVPDENLLILLNGAHFESDEISKMAPVLEELIKHYPKASYVLYLASVYGQLDRLDKQLVLMESLYEDEKLTDKNQVRSLATLYMSEHAPYKAAVVLQKAFDDGVLETTEKDLELLAQAWRLAAEREKAIEILGAAAQLSEDGKLYLQQAYLHFDMAQWDKAGTAIMQSLDKGLEEKFQGEAWLLLGMTRFKMKFFTGAIEACQKAKDFEESHKHAKSWITYISNEMEKYRSMEAPFT